MRFFTTTGPGARVREFAFVRMTAPMGKKGATTGATVFEGFFEVVGPDAPEVMFAKAFKGLRF